MTWRLIFAAVFASLAVAWGGGWGLITGPLRWIGLAVFAALAVVNLLQAFSRRVR